MPVVNYEQYKQMLEKAYQGHYAYPAFNVSNIETANAVLKGLAEAKSDGIIQVSTGGGEHASGSDIKSAVLGAISLANHVRLMADYYDVNVALHTDHCKASKVESFLIPLIEETEKRRAKGEPNLFNSHMFDGSDVTLEENMKIAKDLLARCAKSEIILEVEAGVVGGEEDGEDNSNVKKEKLYTTPEDMLYVYENLSNVENGDFMF
ncbi:MAG: class II fructose-bisphosphate aldolase, partial [Clostridia bacterium]